MTVSDDYPGPLNFNTSRLANSVLVPGRVVVYGVTIYSSNAAAQFFQFFDANTIPADASVPLFAWNVPSHSGVGFSWAPNGRQFQTGLVIVNSTTEATKTIGAADSFFDVQFDVYAEQNAPGTGA